MHKIKQVFLLLHFIQYFVWDAKRSAGELLALHPKQNIESEIKWQTCFGTMRSKFSCSSGKWLISIVFHYSENIIF